MDLRERVVGGVLGLTLGDALGAPFEFHRAADVPDPIPAFERPWMGQPPGSTTDDTAMARNLVRSLGERGGLDPEDVVARHLAWFASGPADVGNLTRKVLARIRSGAAPEDAARSVWEEGGPEVSAGNGSVMYCAPLGFAYAGRPDELFALAPALSALTHWDERCRTAVLAVTLTAAALARGEERDVAAAAGLQALLSGDGFEEALRAIMALGGDTDTNGAVAGALVGAAVGRARLPRAWLARLRERDAIEAEAEALVPHTERTA